MFEKKQDADLIKSFDINSNDSTISPDDKIPIIEKKSNKKFILITLVCAFLLFVGSMVYKVMFSPYLSNTEGYSDHTVMFLTVDDITVNLRQGIDHDNAWLKVKISLEIHGKNNYDIALKMMPKIVDIFQTYLKELRKSDLDGSFGIYKIKDEMLLRINAILYPVKIEAILFQDFIMQVL